MVDGVSGFLNAAERVWHDFGTDEGKRAFYTAAGNESLFQSVAVPAAAAIGFSFVSQVMPLVNPVGLGTIKAESLAGKVGAFVVNHALAKPYGFVGRVPHFIPRLALGTVVLLGFAADKLWNGITKYDSIKAGNQTKDWNTLKLDAEHFGLELLASPASALVAGACGQLLGLAGIPEWIGSSVGFFALRELQTLYLTHEYDRITLSDWLAKHAWKNALSALLFMGVGTAVHRGTDQFFNVSAASRFLTPFQRFTYRGFASMTGASAASFGLAHALLPNVLQEETDSLSFGDYLARDLRAGAVLGACQPLFAGHWAFLKKPPESQKDPRPLPTKDEQIATFTGGLNTSFLEASGGRDHLTAILKKTANPSNDVQARLKALFNKICYTMDELEWVGGYGSSTTLRPTPFRTIAEVKNFVSNEIPDFILCTPSPTRFIQRLSISDSLNPKTPSLLLDKWARTEILFKGLEYAYNRRTPEGTDTITLSDETKTPMQVQLKTKDGVLDYQAWKSGKNLPVNDRMSKLDLANGDEPGNSILWVNPMRKATVVADLSRYAENVRAAYTDQALSMDFVREMTGREFAERYAEVSYRHELLRLITELSPTKVKKLTDTLLGISGHHLAETLNARITSNMIKVRKVSDPSTELLSIDSEAFQVDPSQFHITINRSRSEQVRTALRTRMDMLEAYEHYLWNQANWYIADSELANPVERMMHKIDKTPFPPLKWLLAGISYSLTGPLVIAGRYRYNDALTDRSDLTGLILQPQRPYSLHAHYFPREQTP